MANLKNVNEEMRRKRRARKIAETLYDTIICDPEIPDDMMGDVIDALIGELYLFKDTCRVLNKETTSNIEEF